MRIRARVGALSALVVALAGSAAGLVACGGGGDDASDSTVARSTKRALAVAAPAQSTWSAPIALPLVPSAAANLPDGKLLLWSSDGEFGFSSQPGSTYTSLFDPATGTATERLAAETTHNMFCPGTTNLPDGRILVSGGSSSAATSLYDPATAKWTAAANLNIPRAYQANTLLGDGSVLTLGGSWNGGQGNKHAELWTAAGGWRRLSGVPVDPMVGPDPAGVYRGDNHMWLIPTGFGRVLHAGPSAAMNWIYTTGNGATLPAGPRGDDPYAINGSTVMYDIGKLLKTGGGPAYQDQPATASAHLIDVNDGTASVRRLASMAYARAYHNSVVLPNGQVLILGGQTLPVPFSDDRSVLAPELWDPATEQFTVLPAMSVPRNYHSTALLLADGRVASIGGGLCGNGCAGNHPDLQIYTPAYLLNADGSAAARPAITAAPTEAVYGRTMGVSTSVPVSAFSLVRLSSTTHTVNNDQRRIPLQFTSSAPGSYTLAVPSNPGILLPGHYMLFALTADGVPSVARTVRVSGDTTPQLVPPGDPSGPAGVATSLNLLASGPGAITFGASGLPPGLALNTASGAITGTPSTAGVFRVSISAANEAGTVSTELLWTVQPPGTATTRYVKLEALSEVNGNPWTSVAEFNLLDSAGTTLARTDWTATADSQETARENGAAANVLDGQNGTIWHTQWSGANPAPPHTLLIDTGRLQDVAGFRMLPRQDGANGRIANWRLQASADGVSWRVLGQGSFANDASEKTVYPLGNVPNRAPVLATPANPTTLVRSAAALTLAATDADGDAIAYAASNLPPGLALNAATGAIAGTPSAVGVYQVVAQASDARGGVATANFVWTVLDTTVVISPVLAPPVASGGTATYTTTASGATNPRYVWNFGDGSAATTASASPATTHKYTAPGLYTVTVTVTGDGGVSSTRSFTQAVYAAASGSARATSSSTIGLQTPSSGNPRLWVVNADGNSVGVFDAVSLAKLGEVTVGVAPRTAAVAPDGRLWVVNQGGTSLSIVDLATRTVTSTLALPRASRPFGIAFAPNGAAAYVTLEAKGQLLKLNPKTGAVAATLDVGPMPHHLSVTPGSDRVLVARFITPPLPGEGTASVATEVAGVKKGGEVVVVGSAFTVERTVVLQHSDKPDSTVQGRGIPNYLAAPAISPDGRSAWVPSKQDNVKRGVLRDGNPLDFQNTVRAVSSRIDLASWAEDYPARIDHDNAGVASAAAFHPTGAYLFVALQTSRQVAVIDPVRKAEVFRFEAGRAPDGLALSADGLRLFVSNFMDRTVQTYDLARLLNYGEWNVPSLKTSLAQATERLSATAFTGKQLFYDARDPRLARDAYMSCAACHSDGGQDGRVWDMSGFGEGLRNTISLRGRAGGQGFRHWSGNFDESQDFEGQIRTFAQGSGLMSDAQFNTGTRSQPLGLAKAGISADLDALAAYLASLDSFEPSPLRNADASLTAAAVAGRSVFNAQCASCHGGAAFTDSAAGNLRNIGTLKPTSGNRLGGPLNGIDTPTLRDVWATAPYLHDGSAPSVADAIAAHTAIQLSATDRANVAAYALQIGSTEPGPRVARHVRLEALSEVNGAAWTSMAEFNLFDAAGTALPRTGWKAVADSQETQAENGAAANAIDGSTGTMWHTAWKAGSPPPPHTFTVDLGSVRSIGGFKYLPRTDGSSNGRIARWNFYISSDGVNWTLAGSGTFANTATEKSVSLAP